MTIIMIRIHLALALCALALMPQGLPAADEDLVLRRFPVHPNISFPIGERETGFIAIERDHDGGSHATAEERLKEFFRQAGQNFPEGSYVKHNPLDNSVIHYNTVENQIVLGRILGSVDMGSMQVRIDAFLVDFPIEEIERIMRSNVQPLPRSEDILQRWREGGGTLLHALNLVTRSGVNAQVMSVRELKYAAGYGHHSPSADADDSVTARSPVSAAFETREYGAILNVTPTVGPDGRTIDLAFVMELSIDLGRAPVTVPGRRSDGKQTMQSQPLFHSRNITASLVVDSQSTHVIGGMTNPNGDGITYIILTATGVDKSGHAWVYARPDYAGESVE